MPLKRKLTTSSTSNIMDNFVKRKTVVSVKKEGTERNSVGLKNDNLQMYNSKAGIIGRDRATNSTTVKQEKRLKKEEDGELSESPISGIPNSNELHGKQEAERFIIDRKYYPLEMSNERVEAYRNGTIAKPIDQLHLAQSETEAVRRHIKKPAKTVLHWFRQDFRLLDNAALSLANEKAEEGGTGTSLICFYLVSPEEYEAHVRSPARVDFIFRTLKILKEDLAKLNIPLWIETVDKKKNIIQKVLELAHQWEAKHIFANMEYEVDELRRDTRLVRKAARGGIDFQVVHDSCVVPPGRLSTKTGGKQFTIYTPWYKTWLGHLEQNRELLELYVPPSPNPETARTTFKDIFDCEIPPIPESKRLPKEKAEYLHSIWPAGEHEALERLNKYLAEKIHAYHDNRNFPGTDGTSVLSVHFAVGTLSARYAVFKAKTLNKNSLSSGNNGIKTWISEVAWRDFYKHILVAFPYVCMNKPFKPEYSRIPWSYDHELFQLWCNGRTGYPIVDAAMRQLNTMGYMHNRPRMIVASFLAKDLCYDWRAGERYFMLNLIDGDFASNNGGWGWSSSSGCDPQPYFRIFNPLLQSEKFDPQGEYIRKWIPELKWIKDSKKIHDPWERCTAEEKKMLEKVGYPQKCVEHRKAKDKALKMYKEGLGRDKP